MVCSDDSQWVRANLVVVQQWAGLVSVMEGHDPVEDLALLALCCEHSVITVGSFGWWAAYLRAACRRRWLLNTRVPNPNTRVGKVREGCEMEGETLYYAGFCRDSTTKYYKFYCANERLSQYIPPGWQPYE